MQTLKSRLISPAVCLRRNNITEIYTGHHFKIAVSMETLMLFIPLGRSNTIFANPRETLQELFFPQMQT